MFGNAVIAGTPRPDALAIPSDAVIRSGKRTLVVVALLSTYSGIVTYMLYRM